MLAKEFKVRINKKERSVKIFYDKKDRESSLNSLRLLTRHPPLYELLFRSMKAVPTLPTITKENIEFLAHRDKRRRFRGKASGAKPATLRHERKSRFRRVDSRRETESLSLSLSPATTSPVNSSEMTGPRFRVYLIRGKAGNSFTLLTRTVVTRLGHA